jgi:ABC-type glycerol-3-phosphate transport system substrate-binding protein
MNIFTFFKIILVCFFLCNPSFSYGQSGEITFYVNRVDLVTNGSFSRWVKEFQNEHPQARVKVEGVADYEEVMTKRFEARNYGDVMLIPRDMPKETYPKYFIPLNDLQLAEKVYFARNWEFEGKQYAYSQGVIAEGIVYNAKIFRDLGIKTSPKTLSEFMALADKIKASGKVAVALNLGASWPLNQWDKSVMVLANDGDYFSKMIGDSAPFSPGKPYYRSIKVAYDFFAKGYSEKEFVTNNWSGSKIDFINNKTAMMYLGNWFVPQLIEMGMPSDSIGFFPMPLDDSGTPKAVLNFDWGLAVSRYSKNPEVAKAWIKFLITKSNFADVAGFIPTDKSRASNMPQLKEYMSYNPAMIPASAVSNDFIRLANKSGMDFMSGGYIRNILLSPDFDESMIYWNKRWKQAKENFNGKQK